MRRSLRVVNKYNFKTKKRLKMAANKLEMAISTDGTLTPAVEKNSNKEEDSEFQEETTATKRKKEGKLTLKKPRLTPEPRPIQRDKNSETRKNATNSGTIPEAEEDNDEMDCEENHTKPSYEDLVCIIKDLQKKIVILNSSKTKQTGRNALGSSGAPHSSNRYAVLEDLNDDDEGRSQHRTTTSTEFLKQVSGKNSTSRTKTSGQGKSIPSTVTSTKASTSTSISTSSANKGPAQTANPTHQVASTSKGAAAQPTPRSTSNGQRWTETKERPPPIHVMQQDPSDSAKILKNELKIKDFHIKRIQGNKHTIYLNNLNDFKRTKEVLNFVKADFFTYTPKQEKNQLFILKGLGYNVDPKDIAEEINSKKIENLTLLEITKFTTKYSIKNNQNLPLYLIKLSPSSQAAALHSIKYINHHVVHFEKLLKRDTMQCHNCQRLGHAAVNCNLAYRCVKCSEEHEPGKCQLKGSEKPLTCDQLYCVLCKSFGHPASYRACPRQLELKRFAQERAESRKKPAPHVNNVNRTNLVNNNPRADSYVQPNVQYAQALRNNNQRTGNVFEPIHPVDTRNETPQKQWLASAMTEFRNIILQTIDQKFEDIYQQFNTLSRKTDFLFNTFGPNVTYNG